MNAGLILRCYLIVVFCILLAFVVFHFHSRGLLSTTRFATKHETPLMTATEAQPKLILIWTAQNWENFITGFKNLVLPICPYRCFATENRTLLSKADAILFHLHGTRPDDLPPPEERQARQVYAVYDHESALRTPRQFFELPRYYFNVSLTYRPESDYFATYDRLFAAKSESEKWSPEQVEEAYAKKNKVAFALISNCNDQSWRKQYITELSKYLNLTLKGRCYEPDAPKLTRQATYEIEAEHFFVLAFENSICDHYVTEKFWRMKRLVVPVVLKRSVVQAVAPFDSFIAVDDFKNARELAEFLIDTSLDKQKYLNGRGITLKNALIHCGSHFACFAATFTIQSFGYNEGTTIISRCGIPSISATVTISHSFSDKTSAIYLQMVDLTVREKSPVDHEC